MTCVSDAADEIAWTYEGNTVINSPCQANTDLFHAESHSPYDCNIIASLAAAASDPYIRSISGPYGCTDRSNDGVTSTTMVIVLGKLLITILAKFVHSC